MTRRQDGLWLVLFAVALMGIGCARIRVTTEIYAPPPLSAEDIREVKLALGETEKVLSALPAAVVSAASGFYAENIRNFSPEVAAAIGTDSDAFGASYALALQEVVLPELNQEITSLAATSKALRTSLDEDTAGKIDRAWLRTQLASFRSDLSSVSNSLNVKLDSLYADNVCFLAASLATLAAGSEVLCEDAVDYKNQMKPFTSAFLVEVKSVSIDRLTARENGIAAIERLPLTDKEVSKIVRARDRRWYHHEKSDTGYWEQYVGDVKAAGFFGNSEFSIVMHGLGDYKLKGVVFDPSQVSQATLDTMAQAINIAAAAYGVPVRAGVSADKQPPMTLPEIQGELAGIKQAGPTRQARMGELFSLLLAQDSKISSAANKNDAAKKQKDEIVKQIRTTAAKLRSGE